MCADLRLLYLKFSPSMRYSKYGKQSFTDVGAVLFFQSLVHGFAQRLLHQPAQDVINTLAPFLKCARSCLTASPRQYPPYRAGRRRPCRRAGRLSFCLLKGTDDVHRFAAGGNAQQYALFVHQSLDLPRQRPV